MMKARLLAWWKGRTLREQRMLLALALVIGLVLGWLLLVRPLADARADVLRRHDAALTLLAETRARAVAVRALRQSASPQLSAPVANVVSSAASEAGFTITRLDGGADGSATLTMAAVRPQAFFAWVAALETGSGIAVQKLSASTNTDQTLSVQVTFGGRAG